MWSRAKMFTSKMKIKSLSVAIIIVAILGIGTGVSVDYFVDGELSKLNEIVKKASIEIKNFSIIKTAQLSEDVQMVIEQASIGLAVGSLLQDNDNQPNSGDEFFINAVNECKFHTDENIEHETCVICVLTDSDGLQVGEGSVDLPSGYAASDTLTIPIDDFTSISDIEVKNVKGFSVGVCKPPTEGCSHGYWKQSQHFDSWNNHLPGDDFKTTFGLGPLDIISLSTGGSNPTLLEALQSGGGGINPLARESVGALLNANAGINYPLTEAEVIAQFQVAFALGTNNAYNAQADIFENLHDNNPDVECPLN
jgi:hypothetical protein